MTDQPKKVKVEVKDKRHTARGQAGSPGDPAGADVPPGDKPFLSRPPESSTSSGSQEADYLADLQRVQADFENFRKRVMRDQADMAGRATVSLVERLLPVLDNFERAISHGEGGAGVALVYKELKGVLEGIGLEEIEAEGAAFDPTVHEAVMVQEDDSVDEPTVKEVQRRGYRLGERLVRPAMVVVARPAEAEPAGEEVAE